MRIRSLVVLGSAAMLVASTAPANASDHSSSMVATIYPLMITKSDATAAGVTGPRLSSFTITSSDKGTPDAPWLCDLSGDLEVEGKGAPVLVAKEFLTLKTGDVSRLSQELHAYVSEARAMAAYRGIVRGIKRCEGQHVSVPDLEADNPGGTTEALTNGTKKASTGGEFLWVNSETTIAGADGFQDHTYLTVRHFGKYIQVFEVESEGTAAKPLTAKQRSAVDALTDSSGDRLRAALT